MWFLSVIPNLSNADALDADQPDLKSQSWE